MVARAMAVAVARVRAVARAVTVAVGGNSDGSGGNTTINSLLFPALCPSPQLMSLLSSSPPSLSQSLVLGYGRMSIGWALEIGISSLTVA